MSRVLVFLQHRSRVRGVSFWRGLGIVGKILASDSFAIFFSVSYFEKYKHMLLDEWMGSKWTPT